MRRDVNFIEEIMYGHVYCLCSFPFVAGAEFSAPATYYQERKKGFALFPKDDYQSSKYNTGTL